MLSLLHQQTGSTICRWLLDRCAIADQRQGFQWQKILGMDPIDQHIQMIQGLGPSLSAHILQQTDHDVTPYEPPFSASTMMQLRDRLRLPEPAAASDAAMADENTQDPSVPETWQPTRVSWPSERVPVEIFELITAYLSRADIKVLRRVNREFESKVSANYFKNVVVPFRSELYGDFAREPGSPRQHPSSTLFSSGSRIFESFGPHILRFALSLEIDEDVLASPPIKPAQAAVPSFWGIYRWPHQSYTRYSDLEGIEDTADETQRMKDALKCLTKVTNMGLCCDPGLGFLTRPDSATCSTLTHPPVFATKNWRREYRTKRFGDDDYVAAPKKGKRDPLQQPNDPWALQRQVLEKMAIDAGYEGEEVNEAIGLLLETENTNLPFIDFDERVTMNMPTPVIDRTTADPQEQSVLALLTAEGHPEVLERPDPRRFPLVPAFLTRAQKELLLELEWAHRAMIQSYVLAMVDNAAIGCYSHLTTLSIAKIPSCHVHIFYRDAFWESFPGLSNVSLGVIADWRKITKPTPGCIEDSDITPVAAVPLVFTLLNRYIGRQPNIESLHFEWICGGEFAPSSFQRNQYILPAPFFENPQDMLSASNEQFQGGNLLSLPHLKHLSLKNCWSSPHVFIQTIREMALSSLEKLEMESVSLSGQPTNSPQFPLGVHNGQAAAHANPQMLPNGFVGMAAQLLPGHHANNNPNNAHVTIITLPQMHPIHGNPTETLALPDLLTWSGFLEHFSPGGNIRRITENELQLRESRWPSILANASEFIPDSHRLFADEKRYKIKAMSLKSCGYVCVDANNLNTRGLLPPGAHGVVPPSHSPSTPQRIMQRCKDKEFGQILPYIRPQEAFNLTHAYCMDIGWEQVYGEKTYTDAVADGVDFPGFGRFSGVLEARLGHRLGTAGGWRTRRSRITSLALTHFDAAAAANNIHNAAPPVPPAPPSEPSDDEAEDAIL